MYAMQPSRKTCADSQVLSLVIGLDVVQGTFGPSGIGDLVTGQQWFRWIQDSNLSKGVATIRQLAFGPNSPILMFNFRPDDGPRAAVRYQQVYGPRGQHLIEVLGSGILRSATPRPFIGESDWQPVTDNSYRWPQSLFKIFLVILTLQSIDTSVSAHLMYKC
ncbi:uncharacterized protein LOC111674375 [Orussus abietinus]|uniref:uncharacterized protein LOC111674375 n=1 Tax=Orussus abietinus TaxID=222816 RepID=UPI000C715D78|nr:uncharacterized protein LOC111674375 [Orussus abietinus]